MTTLSYINSAVVAAADRPQLHDMSNWHAAWV